MSERLETEDGLADTESELSSKHESFNDRRTRRQRIRRAILAPGRVTLRAGGKALHGVAYGVAYGVGKSAGKARAGVGATVDGVRERAAKHQQRKEAALAQENDPFSITETHEDKTARMQQTAPPPTGSARAATPEASNRIETETWEQREDRIRNTTVLQDVPGWQLASVLVKADDDLRQEMFCMHLIKVMQRAFRREHLHQLADGLRSYSIQVPACPYRHMPPSHKLGPICPLMNLGSGRPAERPPPAPDSGGAPAARAARRPGDDERARRVCARAHPFRASVPSSHSPPRRTLV